MVESVTVGVEPDNGGFVDGLVELSVRGLRAMFVPATREFVQTVRGLRSHGGPRLVPEGRNLRYAAIAALGISRLDPEARQRALGEPLEHLLEAVAERALTDPDPGAVALAAWAAAEAGPGARGDLLARLDGWIAGGAPLATVDVAWMLTAAVSAAEDALAAEVAAAAAARLLAAQGPAGTFPHRIPAASQSRLRAHVGSFADQVYPLQALARHAQAGGGQAALTAADACADRLVALQGPQGQWWWHYDLRDGSVVESYPVYSVHQHAMAPMTLLDLAEAGGHDHTDAVLLGLSWLRTHPECFDELVDHTHSVVWRKVGRREPRKAARSLNAVTTAARPGLRLPGLDRVFPPGVVDRECRPYELGWLLYAWLRPSGRAALAGGTAGGG